MIKREGPGWRLARDSSRGKYSVLIGGEQWAFELTEEEGLSLFNTVKEITNQFENIKNQLMEDEHILIDLEKPPWKVFLEGNKYDWSLKFILIGNNLDRRGSEFFWPESIAKTATAAMRFMWD